MPIIGERRRADKIGKKGRSSCVWAKCVSCGETRWVRLGYEHLPCKSCSSKAKGRAHRSANHPRWRGGRRIGSDGYIQILLQPDDFYFSMAGKTGYVREHRLVIAKSLQRCLLPWEIVHHRNGVRQDNRIENLKLLKGQADHTSMCILQKENERLKRQIRELQTRIALTEAEVILLRQGVPHA